MRRYLLFSFCIFLLPLLVFPWVGTAQTWQWATVAQGATAQSLINGQSFCVASAPDRAGNTVVVGNFSGTLVLGTITLTSAGDRDIFVARLSPTGTWLQAVRAGGAGKDLALTVAVDANGTAVVGGSYGGRVTGSNGSLAAQFGTYTLPDPAGQQEAYVARLSAAGTWTQAIRASGNGQGEVKSLVLDSSGNALVGGYFSGASYTFGTTTLTNSNHTIYNAEGFVARLSPLGSWGQVTQLGGSDSDYVEKVALDANGNALVSGNFYSTTMTLGSSVLLNSDPTTASTDIFVGRLSPSGTWLQAARVGGSRQEALAAIVPEANGGLAIAISFASPIANFGSLTVANAKVSTSSSYDLAIARQDATGTWTQAVQVGGTGSDIVEDMSTESSGTLTVVGHFTSATLSFGKASLINTGPTTTEDLFVARLGPTGDWLRAVTVSSTSDAEALSVCASEGGSVTVSGYLGATTTFGTTTVDPFSYGRCFVARLVDLPLLTSQPTMTSMLYLAPNPGQNSTVLSLSADAVSRPVILMDVLGREIRHFELPAQATSLVLNLAELPSGNYFVRCGTSTRHLVVE